MVALKLEEILNATGGRLVGAAVAGETLYQSYATDSRKVSRSTLFFALRGQKHDGHAFVVQALAAGALAAVVEDVPSDATWARGDRSDGPPLIVVPSSQKAIESLARYVLRARPDVHVVGVTGSIGKTTTKEVIGSVLARKRRTIRNEGNLNTEVGLPLTVLNTVRPDTEIAVLEMGMYDVGDIRLLAEIAAPRIGVVTAVQPVHLSRLGTIERIQQAKQELVEALPRVGVAVLNADDPRVLAMAAATPARVVTYGVSADATMRAEDVVSRGLRGVEFELCDPGGQLHVHLPMLGAHSVHAALAAAAVAREEGFSLAEAAEALHLVSPALHLLVQDGVGGSRVIDDTYNASPQSVLAALNLLAELPGRRKIAVLGDMLELGSEEVNGHRLVGNRAALVVDVLITVGERASIIAEEARASGLKADHVFSYARAEDVIEPLRDRLRPGDDVLVKGSHAMGLESVVRALRTDEAD